jgi:hypothetical protein
LKCIQSASFRAIGESHSLKEVGVYTVGPDDLITREQFFYDCTEAANAAKQSLRTLDKHLDTLRDLPLSTA